MRQIFANVSIPNRLSLTFVVHVSKGFQNRSQVSSDDFKCSNIVHETEGEGERGRERERERKAKKKQLLNIGLFLRKKEKVCDIEWMIVLVFVSIVTISE